MGVRMSSENPLKDLSKPLLKQAARGAPREGLISATLMGRFAKESPKIEAVNDLDILFVYEKVGFSALNGLRRSFEMIEEEHADPDTVVATRFVNGPVKVEPVPAKAVWLFHVSLYDRAQIEDESPLLLRTWLDDHRTLIGEDLSQIVPDRPLTPADVLHARLGVTWALSMVRNRHVPFAAWKAFDDTPSLVEDRLGFSDAEFVDMLDYAFQHALQNTVLALAGVPDAARFDTLTGIDSQPLSSLAVLKARMSQGAAKVFPDEIDDHARALEAFLTELCAFLEKEAGRS